MEIKTEFRNDLLKRKEVILTMESTTNPGKETVTNEIVKVMKTDVKEIVLRTIKNNFGTHKYVIEAFVYDSKEDLDKIEPKKKAKKGNK